MAVEKSYARLGLFLVVALVTMIATTLLFVQRMRSREVLRMVTYLSENVTGLDISSPVRFRGVAMGQVTDLRIDPGGETIEVDFDVFLERLATTGGNVQRIREFASQEVFPKMRARVVSNPVTGEAYLLLDIPDNVPPPAPPPRPSDRAYVASMPSPLAVVQDRLPAVLESTEATLRTLGEIVTRIPGMLDRTEGFFTTIERVIDETRLPELSAEQRVFFARTSEQFDQITANLNGLIGTGGTLVKFAEEARTAIDAADLPGATHAARDAMDQTTLAADDLRRSLPAIRESIEQLRELARQLQEQPESVVYGPRPVGVKPK